MDVKVKICGITSAYDAEMVVEEGADALGLMFYPGSSRHISLETAEIIARGLPSSILRVGVFADPLADDVFAAIHRCALNILQFHGQETPQFCQQFGIMAMKAFRIQDEQSLLEIPNYHTEAFLLDSYRRGQKGGTGETFNWSLAVAAKKFGKPIFLAGGLTPDNVAEAVRRVEPFGVDVSSGVEDSPGKKNDRKVRDFIKAVRSA